MQRTCKGYKLSWFNKCQKQRPRNLATIVGKDITNQVGTITKTLYVNNKCKKKGHLAMMCHNKRAAKAETYVYSKDGAKY